MRAGAEWIYDREGFSGDGDPTWLGVGYIVADSGAALLLVALILGGDRRATPPAGRWNGTV